MKATKNLYLTALMLAAFTAGAWAQTSTAPKPRPKRAKPAPITAADVQSLKDAIASQQVALAQQQQQIQQLRDELQHRDQSVQQVQTAANDAATKAEAAQAQATQQQQSVGELKSDVADLKTNVSNAALSLQETQKNVNTAIQNPLALHYKGITITPGGYLSADLVRRSRALGADTTTPLNSLTMPGASQSSLSEFYASGRQSRISMLVDGRMKNAKLGGYIEADFNSAGVTSNNNSTNSYTMRQRQAWGQAAFDNGWSVTAGQMWTLLTEQRQGIGNLNAKGGTNEAIPMTIDTSYNVGFTYGRQYGVRLVKNFNNKAWFGVSVENSQATVTTHSNETNFLVGAAGTTGGAYNNQANYSFNPSPDVVAKLAFEPGFGHYEVFGVYSRFRDRIFPCGGVAATAVCDGLTGPTAVGASNRSKDGGGFGANARWSLAHKKVDFGLHAFGGSGVGRYAAGGLPDASIHANGTLDLMRHYQGLASLEWHGPKLDLYSYAGAEYASRAADFDPVNGKVVGYGAPAFANLGCYLETPPTANSGFAPGTLANCTADTRVLIEGTAGFWYRLYDGSRDKDKPNYGRLQWGVQYSYVTRNTWSGQFGLEPHGLNGMVFASFRYYLP